MIEIINRVIEKQKRKITRFEDGRSLQIEHVAGSGKTTGGCICAVETEAVYELRGMEKILRACEEK